MSHALLHVGVLSFAFHLHVFGAAGLLERAITDLGVTPSELNVIPDRIETRLELPLVEELLEHPVEIEKTEKEWYQQVSALRTSEDLVKFASKTLLRESLAFPNETLPISPCVESTSLPEPVEVQVKQLLSAIATSKQFLDKAVASLSEQEQQYVMDQLVSLGENNDSEANIDYDEPYKVASKFDIKSLHIASRVLTRSIDRALEHLVNLLGEMEGFEKRRIATSVGDFLITGQEGSCYTKAELENVVLLIDFSRRHRFEGDVAAAQKGQVRVVLDFGQEVEVKGEKIASGVFGIGLFYLPNAQGEKSIEGEDISLGAGFFGTGGLYARGEGMCLKGGRFSQGAGAFGIGFLDVKGENANYAVGRSGQGFGFTQGVGLFLHEGDFAKIEGGLIYGDFREPTEGAESMAQGVGYGRRAYAAGGIGVALLNTNHSEVHSSYFAQGCGYWHSLGAFFLNGESNIVKARRYQKGAGIHSGLGISAFYGDHNQLIGYMVGPGFGWDYGVGYFRSTGNENLMQTQCQNAMGHGGSNGHGFVVVEGDHNQIIAKDLATGSLTRGGIGYGLGVISGYKNSIAASFDLSCRDDKIFTPRGGFKVKGSLDFVKDVSPFEVVWPTYDGVESEDENDSNDSFDQLPLSLRVPSWLAKTSVKTLEGREEWELTEKLLSLSKNELPYLAHAVGKTYEELLLLFPIFTSYGKNGLFALLDSGFLGGNAHFKVRLLGFFPAFLSVPKLAKLQLHSDWKIREAVATSYGKLFDRSNLSTKGRRFLFEAFMGEDELDWATLLKGKQLVDLYSIVSLAPDFSAEDRFTLAKKNRALFAFAQKEAVEEFSSILSRRKKAYEAAIQAELFDLKRLETSVAASLLKLLEDPHVEVRKQALIALGKLGREKDLSLIVKYLDDSSMTLRCAASLALSCGGEDAKEMIGYVMKEGSHRAVGSALLAASYMNDSEVYGLIRTAFNDSDSNIRREAVLATSNISGEFEAFIEELQILSESDRAVDVRYAAHTVLKMLQKKLEKASNK